MCAFTSTTRFLEKYPVACDEHKRIIDKTKELNHKLLKLLILKISYDYNY